MALRRSYTELGMGNTYLSDDLSYLFNSIKSLINANEKQKEVGMVQ